MPNFTDWIVLQLHAAKYRQHGCQGRDREESGASRLGEMIDDKSRYGALTRFM